MQLLARHTGAHPWLTDVLLPGTVLVVSTAQSPAQQLASPAADDMGQNLHNDESDNPTTRSEFGMPDGDGEHDSEFEGDHEYSADHISDHRRTASGTVQLKVHWAAPYDEDEPTWEPEDIP